jgi:hypothetical protein
VSPYYKGIRCFDFGKSIHDQLYNSQSDLPPIVSCVFSHSSAYVELETLTEIFRVLTARCHPYTPLVCSGCLGGQIVSYFPTESGVSVVNKSTSD